MGNLWMCALGTFGCDGRLIDWGECSNEAVFGVDDGEEGNSGAK